jgi:diguanylate cyclase (GGDEF)-like protein/PAS domain S-box-containing protein
VPRDGCSAGRAVVLCWSHTKHAVFAPLHRHFLACRISSSAIPVPMTYSLLPAQDAQNASALERAEAGLRESEAYFRSLVENARDVIHVVNPDWTTRYITPSVQRLLGYHPEELIGRSLAAILHEDDVESGAAAVAAAGGVVGFGAPIEARVRHRDGSWRIFEGVVRNMVDDPVVRGIVINCRDITERRRREAQVARLAAIAEENPNPIVECDLEGRPTYANPAAGRLVQELGVDGPEGLFSREHAAVAAACLGGGDSDRVEVEVGTRVLCWTYYPHPGTGAIHLFGEDVTERKRVESRLLHHALHDPLTGLPNRHFFMERLAGALLRYHRREGGLFAVLFLDLDRFKVVNDSLGHHVGDELLQVIGERLRGTLRGSDTVARFGGDEFAVLLEGLESLDEATCIAERLSAVLAAPINLSGYEVFTSASIGIALCSAGLDRPEYMLRNADVAMYQAKGSGAARYEIFDRGMHAQALARLQMETDLRRALSRDEFRLHYQPIVDLRTGRIAGLEALLRWEHPERGLIAPAEFISIAEETGVILPLGDWVLREACRQLATWRGEFRQARIAMSVNLSAKQFGHADLVERICSALEDADLDPRHLKLEVTESAIIDSPNSAGAMLLELRRRGIQIQMDDFGTGYSSLSSLHSLPLDGIKIDRSFISRIPGSAPTLQMVRAIALLARGLGLALIAEGVETPEQLEEVRALGCEFAQGYLLSHPLAPEGIRALLGENPRW